MCLTRPPDSENALPHVGLHTVHEPTQVHGALSCLGGPVRDPRPLAGVGHTPSAQSRGPIADWATIGAMVCRATPREAQAQCKKRRGGKCPPTKFCRTRKSGNLEIWKAFVDFFPMPRSSPARSRHPLSHVAMSCGSALHRDMPFCASQEAFSRVDPPASQILPVLKKDFKKCDQI